MPKTREPAIEIPFEDAQERVLEALRSLRFGAVEIQVHDCRIVRITRTEKVRVERVPPDSKVGRSPK